MPRLYLHQRSDENWVEDLEGADFADLNAAMDEAIEGARSLMAARVREGLNPDGWRFEITNPRGEVLAVVPFRDKLSRDGSVEDRKAQWLTVPANHEPASKRSGLTRSDRSDRCADR